MPIKSPVSAVLKELRERSGLSVRKFADHIGVNASTYQTYENNFKQPYLPVWLVEKVWAEVEGKGEPPIGAEDYGRLLGVSVDSLQARIVHDDPGANPEIKRPTKGAQGDIDPKVGEIIKDPSEVALIRFWRRLSGERREMAALLLASVGFAREENQNTHP